MRPYSGRWDNTRSPSRVASVIGYSARRVRAVLKYVADMAVLNVESMCLTRLCGEICYRMSELASATTGPKLLGVRRIQTRPIVYRTDHGKIVTIVSAPESMIRVPPSDARTYLGLLRNGYASTLGHWLDIQYQISKESPKLVIELFFIQRNGNVKLVVVSGDPDWEQLVAEYMTDGETTGWWLEHSFIE